MQLLKNYSPNLKVLLSGIFAVLEICGLFLSVYWKNLANGIPVSYDGDTLQVLARMKAVSEGEFIPFVPNKISRLNAPDGALWSDVPVEDFIFIFPALITPIFGLFNSSTIYLMLIFIMSGMGFYFSALWLGAKPLNAAVFSILFAVLPYSFTRKLEHLTLSIYI